MGLIHRATVIFDTGLYGLMKLISTCPLHLTLMICVFARYSQKFYVDKCWGFLATYVQLPQSLCFLICAVLFVLVGKEHSYQSFSFLSF